MLAVRPGAQRLRVASQGLPAYLGRGHWYDPESVILAFTPTSDSWMSSAWVSFHGALEPHRRAALAAVERDWHARWGAEVAASWGTMLLCRCKAAPTRSRSSRARGTASRGSAQRAGTSLGAGSCARGVRRLVPPRSALRRSSGPDGRVTSDRSTGKRRRPASSLSIAALRGHHAHVGKASQVELDIPSSSASRVRRGSSAACVAAPGTGSHCTVPRPRPPRP